ncbi:phage tail protein [Moraxella haemolytica]|uniref:phage tail-collar fiber domain-containing protein n=1 Tax=Moraxella haemolytica TaxID=2904119 RepID=UPI002542B3C0|nr:phage tail protein [Moraxella sp. ZY171148]WII94705.1 phage tail protein [Moraxella sp. ZY171148]
MSNHHTIMTNNGKALFAIAAASNESINITHLAVGDSNNVNITPTATQTKLVHERHRIAVNSVERHPTNANWIEINAIIPSDSGGYTVREIGLYADSTLIAVGSFPATYKPAQDDGVTREMSIRIIIAAENASVVTVTLDDSLVYATKKWTQDNFINHNEVINTLTSTDTVKPLSAAQGKVLNDTKLGKTENAATATKLRTARTINGVAFDGTANITIFDDTKAAADHRHNWREIDSKPTTLVGYGITDFRVQTATGDLDTYTDDGIYSFNSSGSMSNAPVPSASGHLIVIAGGNSNANWCRQIFKKHYSNETYERYRTSRNNTWSDWMRTDGTINNTLSSTATDQSLSAAQGKVLNDTKLGKTENAATATKLRTARTINGVAFDGTANITIFDDTKAAADHRHNWREIDSKPTTLVGYGITDFRVQTATGDLDTYTDDGIYSFNSSGSMSNAPVPSASGHLIVIAGGNSNANWCRQIFKKHYSNETYERYRTSRNNTWSDWMRTDGTINNTLSSTATDQSLSAAQGKVLNDTKLGKTENAATATKLRTARTINGVAFDGTANITIFDDTKAAADHRHNWREIDSKPTTLVGYGITDFRVQTATGDLDTYTDDGIYSFNSSGSMSNAPVPSASGHLIVIAGGNSNANWCRQIFKKHYSNETYERYRTSRNNTWSDWMRTDGTINNTLSSTATDQSLSAAQGKVLNDTKLGKTENAATATKLRTARTISLTGAVTGSVNFDGSGNVSVNTTVQSVSNKVVVMTGVIDNGGTIPLPAGFSERQCNWLVSIHKDNPADTKWDIYEFGLTKSYGFECYTLGRVVTARTYLGGHGNLPGWIPAKANYIIIGVK